MMRMARFLVLAGISRDDSTKGARARLDESHGNFDEFQRCVHEVSPQRVSHVMS